MISIPPIGLGTWQASGPECQRAVEHALAAGYRHVDTAQLYGNEPWVGAALRASAVPRDQIFLTTKVRADLLEPKQVLASTEGSLHRLGTTIDLLLIHWPSPDIPVEATLDAMRLLQEDGKVRHIGVSNFPSALLERACRHAPIACNQVEYHPYLAQAAVLAACRRHDVVLAAYCPLARGLVVDDRVLREIGALYDRTPAQVALRWLIQQPGVVALPKSVTPSRIEENLGALDFTLTGDEVARIHALGRGQRLIDPSFAPAWDEQ